jgi:hypothetical protein
VLKSIVFFGSCMSAAESPPEPPLLFGDWDGEDELQSDDEADAAWWEDHEEAKHKKVNSYTTFTFSKVPVLISGGDGTISGKVWKGSLLAACRLLGLRCRVDHDPVLEATPYGSLEGLDVMEVGCGRALPGLASNGQVD